MLLVSLALTGLFADPAGPLAPARDGLVQCYDPNIEQRTCKAIGSYRFEPNGVIINEAESAISASPRVVIFAEAEVFVRDDAECATEPAAPDDIRAIEVEGEPLAPSVILALREEIVAAMNATMGDGEYCSTFHPKPDGSMTALVTVGGRPRPELTSVVRWVRREDGWRVAP